MMIRLFQEPFENGGAVSEIRFKMHDIVCILHTRKQDRPRIEKGKLSIPGTQGRGAPSNHRCEDPQRDDWSPRGTSASARESLGQIVKTSKAPRDPVASSRPSLPCTVLVFSNSDLTLLLVQDARLFSTLITGKCGLDRPQPGPLRTHLCVYRSSMYVCLCGCIDGSPVQRKEREREMDRTQSANSCRT